MSVSVSECVCVFVCSTELMWLPAEFIRICRAGGRLFLHIFVMKMAQSKFILICRAGGNTINGFTYFREENGSSQAQNLAYPFQVRSTAEAR